MIQLVMIILLVLPLIFQLIFGIKVIKGSTSLNFWQVSLISLVGQIFSAIGNLFLMSEVIRLANSRDGLPWIGVFIMELLVGFVLLLVILIQLYIHNRKKKVRIN